MTNTRRLSHVTLRIDPPDHGGRGAVEFLVDGRDPFAVATPTWRGFAPAEMLGPDSPLSPVEGGRRVALRRCSCGQAGCGVVAAMIVPSPDRRRVSWVDFRDFVGEYAGPLAPIPKTEGTEWELPDLHFDRDQYLAELDRAAGYLR